MIANTPTAWALEPGYMRNLLALSGGTFPTSLNRNPVAPTFKRGIAVISIEGMLFQRDLADLKQTLEQCVADPQIGGIMLDLDTPGGTVSGTPEAAATVLAARQKKPVYGFVSGICASAGYWIGSACTKLYATQSASVGSIGVFTTHVDESKALANAGYAIEYVAAGKHKTDGNSLGPMGAEARAFVQSQINDIYTGFVNSVAKGRGVPALSVRSGFGQGRCLLAKHSLDAGMIDGVCSRTEVIRRLQAEAQRPGTARQFDAFTKQLGFASRERALRLLGG